MKQKILLYLMLSAALFFFSASGADAINVSPASINFGNINVGGSSSQTITISNTGAANLLIETIFLGGDNPYQFSIRNNTCAGATIAPSGSCTLDAVFSPTKTGILSAFIGILSDDPYMPSLQAGLTGTGVVPGIAVTPLSRDFGIVAVGSFAIRTFTISNTGAGDLVIETMFIGGDNPYQFSIQNNTCIKTPIAPAGSCTIDTVFSPARTGILSASLGILSNDSLNPAVKLELTGTGVVSNIAPSPTGRYFGNVITGSSARQTFTISNSGTEDLVIVSTYLTGDNPYQFSIQNNTCASAIMAPLGNCAIDVIFNPTKTGSLSAFLSIVSNNPVTAPTVKLGLAGTGVPDTKQYSLTVVPQGALYGIVTSSPAGIDCETDCAGNYYAGTAVTLTATPTPASTFTGWTGCDAPCGNTCLVEMDTDKIVTATFDTPVPVSIPPEVAHETGYVAYLLPPAGFTAGLGWLQAIHDVNRPGPSSVEVDWMRLYCVVNGQDVLIESDEYDDAEIGGGLYTRYPWFETGFYEDISADFNLTKGYAVLTISDYPDNVWHWWNTQWPRALIPAAAERCFMEALVRIQGPALVQAGLDYWREPDSVWEGTNVNNVEAGISDWLSESDQWQLISIAASFPNISASPLSRAFGNIAIGSSATQTFTISNTGTGDLTISAMYLAGDNPYQFSIQNNTCASATIPQSGSCTIDVLFVPTKTGALSSYLGIWSNDSDTPSIKLWLNGTGI